MNINSFNFVPSCTSEKVNSSHLVTFNSVILTFQINFYWRSLFFSSLVGKWSMNFGPQLGRMRTKWTDLFCMMAPWSRDTWLSWRPASRMLSATVCETIETCAALHLWCLSLLLNLKQILNLITVKMMLMFTSNSNNIISLDPSWNCFVKLMKHYYHTRLQTCKFNLQPCYYSTIVRNCNRNFDVSVFMSNDLWRPMILKIAQMCNLKAFI